MPIDIDACYRRYGPMVLRRCHRLLRSEELAADAMHDVFVQLLRHDGQYRDERMGALLQRIATNVCLNRLRTQRRRPEDPEEELLLRIAATEEDAEASVATRGLLGRIFGRESESTRTIAVLHLVDGLTLEDVAREVGLSVSGVRKRLRTLKGRVAQLEGV
ncbi:MAG: sigma-70 family RNA polymerase sigma factor [Deltaproteobacteria bacterium]|nr:sigma-70 family RNA polymerase sigma factor [Deltaproteobacteria bacterium]